MKKEIEEIRPNLFRLQIPLPDSPLKYLNAYVVKSNRRNLIVDTGLNRSACLAAMQAGLQALDIDIHETDFFITHLHADHFGLVARLATEDSRIYFNRPDAELIESWEGFGPMIAFAGRNGFPQEELRSALEAHPGHKFGSSWVPDLNILKDGQTIDVGDYHFQCVETPGHTLGHTCLYEASEKLFIAGDHMLIDITPNIQCWDDTHNPLKLYLESLDKVSGLAVDIVLPGHRRVFTHFRQRIGELKQHHRERLEEVLAIAGNGTPRTAFSVASKMKWDIKSESWEAFPVAQKWFATGEAIAHLRYLEEERKLQRHESEGVVMFDQNR
ncbi:MAG: MBL fold metallo-hydrolase [Deltaproteobacteria bacterium]|nr:MBL fold metallo-hydrolase [Deltaproteobacteria bacterium]